MIDAALAPLKSRDRHALVALFPFSRQWIGDGDLSLARHLNSMRFLAFPEGRPCLRVELVHPEGQQLPVFSCSKDLCDFLQELRNALLGRNFEALALGRQVIALTKVQRMNGRPPFF